MPYNTRRKSLSLTELGIIVPKRSRTQSHPSPPNTIAEGEEPPVKKSKRSHPSASPPPSTTSSRTSNAAIRVKDEKPKPRSELSPPPSPVVEGRSNKVDVEGISDEIVVATIRQLEQTGNRPHLVKELAAILSTSLGSAEKYADTVAWEDRERCANLLDRSTNPTALISSRLTAYINRSWPAISPCPLAKDLSASHPRRLYFFLTTMPRQPMPKTAEPLLKDLRIISPSLSSASAAGDDEDEDTAAHEHHLRQRQALSPSPEVDLSSPELDDEDSPHQSPHPGAPFSGRSSVARERSASVSLAHGGRRAASPPLENEERDFKQTATAVFEEAQKRWSSKEEKAEEAANTTASDSDMTSLPEHDPEDRAYEQNREVAAALFGQDNLKSVEPSPALLMMEFSSPIIAPRNGLDRVGNLSAVTEQQSSTADDEMDDVDTVANGVRTRLDVSGKTHSSTEATTAGTDESETSVGKDESDWEATLQSPETVEMDELDDLFDAY